MHVTLIPTFFIRFYKQNILLSERANNYDHDRLYLLSNNYTIKKHLNLPKLDYKYNF